MKPFTPFNQQAPLTRGLSCLEASAGTGKTYTISGLVLRLIAEQGLEIDEVLVVTFTRAATAELRDRIRRILVAAVHALQSVAPGPEEGGQHQAIEHLMNLAQDEETRRLMLQRLKRANEGFDEATITTIHGFCQRVLQRYAFESGVSLGGDDLADVTPLIHEVTADWWTKACYDADPFVIAHMENRAVNPEHLHALASATSVRRAIPLIPARHAEVSIEEIRRDWGEAVQAYRQAHATHIESAMSLLEALIHGDAHILNKPFREFETSLKRLEERQAWLEGPLPYPRLHEHLEMVSATYIQGRTAQKKTPPTHPLFEATDRLLVDLSIARTRLDELLENQLHDFRVFVDDSLEEAKRVRDVQSFDDLLTRLHRCVSGPEARPQLVRAISGQFRAALIDEFQDTDNMQWEVFRSLFATPDHYLYVVGDPKQAIYGFRGADIEAYLAARAHPDMAVHMLDENHRSDGAMVRAVNRLFSLNTDPFLNDAIGFEPVRAAKAEARLWLAGEPQPALTLSFLHRDAFGVASGKPLSIKSNGTIERWVASEIARFLAEPVELEEGDQRRRVRPSDIAVLTRKNKQAVDIQRALRDLGIPSALENNDSVYATEEASELLVWLEAVMEPSRVGRVRASLIGPLIGGSTAWLSQLDEDDGWLDSWMRRFGQWKRTWLTRGFAALFRQWLLEPLQSLEGKQTPPLTRLLSVHAGERRVTNLLHLSELIHRASTEDDLDPQGLIGWLRERISEPHSGSDDSQIRLESDANAVNIVTIHKSKGLEYPIVWAPYLGMGSGGTKKRTTPLRFRGSDGQWCVDIHLDPNHPARQAHHALVATDDEAQELRLAYVAMTRARHQCRLMWGALGTADGSPLYHLLNHGEGNTVEKESDEALLTHLQALVDQSSGAVEIATYRERLRGLVYQPKRDEQTPLSHRKWTRKEPLDRLWRRASFSALIAGGRHRDSDDHAPHDHDGLSAQQSAGPDRLTPEDSGSIEVTLADFPKGAQAGTCVHTVYEHLDFEDPTMVRALCDTTLARFGFDAEMWAQPLSSGVIESLQTTLCSERALKLEGVAQQDRFDELDFTLVTHPTEGATSFALAEAMATLSESTCVRAYAEQLGRLSFDPVRGFLVGSIDLVFRSNGRFYVVDYKSNHLGRTRDSYAEQALNHAMMSHHYILQYHLYTVALHRYLSWRIPDYDYERDMGGVFYLFLRGMHPSTGPSRGVYSDRPSAALILALDRLLRGEP